MSVLQADGVWKTYAGTAAEGADALRGADFQLGAREVVALYGKSGSGKTTLLHLLAGLDRPSRGRVLVEGRDLEDLGERGRTELRRRRLGFVFQFFNLLPTLTVYENVLLSLELLGQPDRGAVRAVLQQVELAGKEGRFPHQLSGGEQQRVAIARALVKRPAVILADEPTGNLDSRTGEAVLELLTAHSRESGAGLLVATHSPAVARWADRVLWMVDGRVLASPGGEPP